MPTKIRCSASDCGFTETIDFSDRYPIREDGFQDVAGMREAEKTIAYFKAYRHREQFKGSLQFEKHFSIFSTLIEGASNSPENK